MTSVATGQWDDASVWDCNCVPNESNSVTIQDGHIVAFTGDKEVYSLHVTENATLSGISGSNLKVNKDVAFYGAANLTGVDVDLGGSDVQTILGNCHFDKLYLSGSNTVDLLGNLFIAQELWVGQCTLNTNGGLVLVSGAEGTGEIGPVFDGNINGSITMNREISTSRSGWISLGSPVSNATCEELVDDFVTTGFVGADYPDHSFNNISYYEEQSDDGTTDFLGITAATDMMEVGRGYYVYTLAGEYLYDVVGDANVGEIDIEVSYTNNESPSSDGLNLVANPYPASINWDSPSGWDKENLVGAVYVWDVSQKQFRTYLNGLGVNGGSAFIKPMESFYVMASGANPQLSINESAKSLHTIETQESLQNIFVTLSDQQWSDDLVITTNSDASLMFEPATDALKFYGDNSVPNISTLSSDNVKLAINSIPEFSAAQDIEMMINIPIEGNYTLSFDNVDQYITNQCIGLEDLVTGEVYDLSLVSEFEFFTPEVEDQVRFVFHIGSPVIADATGIICTGDGNGEIITEGSGDGPWNYRWFDQDMNLIGEMLDESAEHTISNLNGGDYIVQVENNDFCGSILMEVNVFEPEELLTVLSAAYDIGCEEDNTGEILLNVSGGIQPYDVVWDNEMLGANIDGLGAGEYIYTVTDELGCSHEESILIQEAEDVEVSFTADQVVSLNSNNEAEVIFTNTSEGATVFEWDFGDGSELVNEESPSHMFTQPGFFTVSMYANNGQCDDYYQAVVVVEQFSGIAEQDFSSSVSITANSGKILVNSTYSSNQSSQVMVHDILGKLIVSEKGNLGNGSTIEVDLDEANSLYVVSVLNLQTNEKTVRKISRF